MNIAQVPDDEPALLLVESEGKVKNVMLVNEEKLNPRLSQNKHDNESVSNLWYLDNGASNHMTGQKSKLKELYEEITGQVKFGDGSLVEIKRKGSVLMRCKNGGERMLHDVYYIPALCSNIISLGQMAEEGYKVSMCGDYLWVREARGTLFMKVKRSVNRLYKIIINTNEVNCLLAEDCNQEWLWHSRFGHVIFNAMQELVTKKMVQGLPKLQQLNGVCTWCLMSKQVRKSFLTRTNYSASKALELVHGDLCGPITPTTMAGNRYVFLLVDDYSRVM